MKDKIKPIHAAILDALRGASPDECALLLKRVCHLALEMQCRIREKQAVSEYKVEHGVKVRRARSAFRILYVRADGTAVSVAEASEVSGVSKSTLNDRLRRIGMNIDDAMAFPDGALIPSELRNKWCKTIEVPHPVGQGPKRRHP